MVEPVDFHVIGDIALPSFHHQPLDGEAVQG